MNGRVRLEGNGRTQREFIRLLALEKGYQLNLNPADNKSVYDRYMQGTIESDVKTLTELILELLKGDLLFLGQIKLPQEDTSSGAKVCNSRIA